MTSAWSPDGLGDAFHVQTCQREFWVDGSRAENATLVPECAEVYMGWDAYRFLLRVATGLESRVKGEADVFGQLKSAWQSFFEARSETALALGPWMQKLFEDTKEIRANYLQHMGGASYGSLTRKVIRQSSQESFGPVLIVGAGALAQAVAPWMIEHEILLMNRSEGPLEALYQDLKSRPGANVRKVRGEEEETRAWREAQHIVICIPVSPEQDFNRIQIWKQGLGENRTIIHLGAHGADEGLWATLPGFHSLESLFGLQRQAEQARECQFHRALKACDEKAHLRALPPGAPGWEDLALFA